MSDLDPAAVMDDDRQQEREIRALLESESGRSIEAEDYRSLLRLLDAAREALAAEQAKIARVEELAHRFEIVPRARLLGALTAKAKS